MSESFAITKPDTCRRVCERENCVALWQEERQLALPRASASSHSAPSVWQFTDPVQIDKQLQLCTVVPRRLALEPPQSPSVRSFTNNFARYWRAVHFIEGLFLAASG